MAHKRDYKPEDIAFPEQHIVSSELVSEMEKSYIEYAMSVIVGRALPDVRDGLKPVHRRILYAMYEDGLTRDKPYRKCATAVGDVLGRYHPHGDASVYDALVRMGQGVAFLYEPTVRAELESGALREIALSGFPVLHDFTFLWRKSSVFAQTYREIFDLLRTASDSKREEA